MIDIEKALLRREVQQRRAAMGDGARQKASDAAGNALVGLLDRPVVALFWPLAHEIDTRPLLPLLTARGFRPLLSRMQRVREPLVFHEWHDGMVLEEARFGVMQPPPSAPVALPDIVVTPLLAFDRQGHRLGYGAGYYDRTFAALVEQGCRSRRIGFAFACQEVPTVPTGPHDMALDLVVTEDEVIPVHPGPPASA